MEVLNFKKGTAPIDIVEGIRAKSFSPESFESTDAYIDWLVDNLKRFEGVFIPILGDTTQERSQSLVDGLLEHGYVTLDNPKRRTRLNTVSESGAFLDESIAQEKINIPPLFYGTTEFAAAIGWIKQRISTYMSRGLIPQPISYCGVRPLWTKTQIQQFALEHEIEFIDIEYRKAGK